jgi:predicted phosphate transport protein (TIGR00153 family)
MEARMLGRFLPKQNNFFRLFRESATKLVKTAEQFRDLVNDLPNVNEHAKIITDIEQEADKVAVTTYKLLHKTFITPFDRHDINALTTRLDDTLDHINRLAQRFLIYQFTVVPAEVLQLAALSVKLTEQVREVVDKLDSLKNQDLIVQICLNIDHLENHAEMILLNGITRLFTYENDFKQLLKLKEVLEHLKLIINSCQDTANLVKSIVLEYG